MVEIYEMGPIRPPNEAESLLIRVTRNCPWNKCLFCPVYKNRKFSKRSVEEVLSDINNIKEGEKKVREMAVKLTGKEEVTKEVVKEVYSHERRFLQIALWLQGGGKNVFLQDADNLAVKTEDLAQILRNIKETFPQVERITTYARAKTASKKSLEELKELKKAGLTRVHLGLETGHGPLLEYIKKGVTPDEHIEGGLKLKEAGLSLSEYVILGLGGQDLTTEHALDTARVLSKINPHYIRVRTLGVREGIPLVEKVRDGGLKLASDIEILKEKKLLIENLDVDSYFRSDHILNLLEEVNGKLPEDKEKMISIIDEFLELTEEEQQNFCVGRRLGLYRYAGDMGNKELFNRVDILKEDLENRGKSPERLICELGGKFI
ncbi:radical SAM protein [Natranaerofaba carboxydovora]|uniref:radical SAM protein n=1 Tax=Natranaerofaba carboxydovora TaxID=2742683 RepID=UPI001F135814|nr:radical SAM protein [Natranaerofaba carboxydovora]UMZ74471.1 Radical SAM superfamily protein [Natranaerofaba carboxydovora]